MTMKWSWMKNVVELPFSIPQRRRMRERTGYEKDEFVRSFEPHRAVAEAVWDALSREAVVEGFKPMPNDDLIRVWGLADEDLDDVVLAILVEQGCRIPSPEETATMPPVRTVADLVAFVVGQCPAP